MVKARGFDPRIFPVRVRVALFDGGAKMGGRGSKSGMSGSSAEDVAREAFRDNNGVNLKEMKSELKFWRDTEKRKGDLDEDQHYWVIDKDGTEHFYQPGVDTYSDTGINLGKVAYISNQNGDGRYDSNGVSTMDNKIRNLFDDPIKASEYDDEINRLYKTEWGRRH